PGRGRWWSARVSARDSRCGLVRTAAVADPTADGCGAVRRSQLQPRGWSGLGGHGGGATGPTARPGPHPDTSAPNGAPPALTPRTVQPPRLRAPRLALPVQRDTAALSRSTPPTLGRVSRIMWNRFVMHQTEYDKPRLAIGENFLYIFKGARSA